MIDTLALVPGRRCSTSGAATAVMRWSSPHEAFTSSGSILSTPLLLRGGEEAGRRGLTINFIRGDMRELDFENQFDGAYCLFSTFGYFDDETNKKALQNIARALKPNGKVVIEILNRDYLITDLPTRVWWEGEGCVVLEEVELNYFSSRIQVNRSVVFDDGRQLEQEISVRAYSLHEVGKLMHAAGFRVLEVSGGYQTKRSILREPVASHHCPSRAKETISRLSESKRRRCRACHSVTACAYAANLAGGITTGCGVISARRAMPKHSRRLARLLATRTSQSEAGDPMPVIAPKVPRTAPQPSVSCAHLPSGASQASRRSDHRKSARDDDEAESESESEHEAAPNRRAPAIGHVPVDVLPRHGVARRAAPRGRVHVGTRDRDARDHAVGSGAGTRAGDRALARRDRERSRTTRSPSGGQGAAPAVRHSRRQGARAADRLARHASCARPTSTTCSSTPRSARSIAWRSASACAATIGDRSQAKLFGRLAAPGQPRTAPPTAARNDFVKANLRLVVSIARRFNHGRMALADLIQEGNLGLFKAVERYDYRAASGSRPTRAGGSATRSAARSPTRVARFACRCT